MVAMLAWLLEPLVAFALPWWRPWRRGQRAHAGALFGAWALAWAVAFGWWFGPGAIAIASVGIAGLFVARR